MSDDIAKVAIIAAPDDLWVKRRLGENGKCCWLFAMDFYCLQGFCASINSDWGGVNR
ncbi:hypothetical protein [Moraxella caviae]|uniref:hypothetical protein n=1 Tax=Moraxella caviae TaxID=34060 RepID=UPI00130184EE|nr:hypothetical protein [Moraxella caviae]